MRARSLFATCALAALIVACGQEDFRLDPSHENQVDTIMLGGLLTNPDINFPSAYFIGPSLDAGEVVPWQGGSFDFAYDIDSVAGPALYPLEVTGLVGHASSNPGLKPMTTPFDSIFRADLNGYITDEIVPIEVGDVLLGRSAIRCSNGVPMYAKLQILAIDSAAKTMTFQVLKNSNCGYRDLEPGYPEN